MTGRNQITILHLSDLQFGRNHRFAQTDISSLKEQSKMLGGPDSCYDTLLRRICNDLKNLKDEAGLAPELMILTGDLAEWGLKSEFDEVLKFVKSLAEALKLSLDELLLFRVITTLIATLVRHISTNAKPTRPQWCRHTGRSGAIMSRFFAPCITMFRA
jgi:3',5'-cyclic AMP phosphodiesterase CpdA